MAAAYNNHAQSNGIDSRYRWVMLWGVWFLYFCFGLVLNCLAPIVNEVVRDINISLSGMGSVLGSWQFVYLFSAIPLGALIDRIGLRRSLLIASGIIALSIILRGFSTDYPSLWIAVALFGLGGPLISIGAPKLIGHWFSSRERGLAMGIYMTGPSLGGVVSLSMTNSVMMPLFDNRWRSVLLAYSVLVVMSGVAWLLINLHRKSRMADRIESNVEATPRWPVFSQLLRLPVVLSILLMSVGIFTINHGLTNWLPAILQADGMSAVQAGFWSTIPTIVGILGSLTIPALAPPERRGQILTGLFVCALIATLLINHATGPVLALGLVAQGIARSSMMTLAILVLIETPAVGARNMGVAGGLFFTVAEIGGVLGPFSIGYLADLTGSFDTSLHLISLVCVALIALSFVVNRLVRQDAV